MRALAPIAPSQCLKMYFVNDVRVEHFVQPQVFRARRKNTYENVNSTKMIITLFISDSEIELLFLIDHLMNN